uniref:Uncharacterized protein n=1 Tax=Anguilla anguilla TaxID=7936 RepID=A0A0E9S7W8_ANGAN
MTRCLGRNSLLFSCYSRLGLYKT